jgi:hypothetical protein
MRRILSSLSLLVCAICFSAAQAEDRAPASTASAPEKKYVLPEGVTEEVLAPPPVPRFMLEPPSKPLSQAEMEAQAREAEAKAGVTNKK